MCTYVSVRVEQRAGHTTPREGTACTCIHVCSCTTCTCISKCTYTVCVKKLPINGPFNVVPVSVERPVYAKFFDASCTCSSVVERSGWSVKCRGFESHPRQLIFLSKSDCLGCAVLLCHVICTTLLNYFFLPFLISH